MTGHPLEAELRQVRAAASVLRQAPTERKNRMLRSASKLLLRDQEKILEANGRDLAALSADHPPAFRDRLLLDPKRLQAMRRSLEQVARLPDPVGEVVERKKLRNGLQARRQRAPLGVIFMIFESRPNVAIEAFSLALKAGNAAILRGGKESRRTTEALYGVLAAALGEAGLPARALWGISDPDRAIPQFLLRQKQWIDVVVPRGGESLIEAVTRDSLIPIIKNDRGMCHVYVHEDADLAMAARIIANAKTQRPGVCNAIETVLVHEKVAPKLLPSLSRRMPDVELWGCERTTALIPGHARPVTERSYDTEYLDLKLNCRVVGSLEQALEHIDRHGSRHSECIVTKSRATARRFEEEVDCAVAYWNASTRFTDGFELGLGGELGISTQKLHVRGPVGLRELTSPRWIIEGTGQIRK